MIFINQIIKEDFNKEIVIMNVIVIKMDKQIYKILLINIKDNKIEDNKYIDELLKEILNVLIELK